MHLKNYYEEKAVSYGIKEVRLKNILELFKNVKGLSILDVGCSYGYLGAKLKKRGAKVTGIDISKRAINRARRILDNAKVVDLNSEKIPFKNATFDMIVASEVIEHLFFPNSFLKELHRILKKGGILIITTPNLLYWGNRLNFLLGKFKYTQEGIFDESHIHFFTYKTLIEELKTNKFKIVSEKHVYPGPKVLTLVKNMRPSLFSYQMAFKAKKLT